MLGFLTQVFATTPLPPFPLPLPPLPPLPTVFAGEAAVAPAGAVEGASAGAAPSEATAAAPASGAPPEAPSSFLAYEDPGGMYVAFLNTLPLPFPAAPLPLPNAFAIQVVMARKRRGKGKKIDQNFPQANQLTSCGEWSPDPGHAPARVPSFAFALASRPLRPGSLLVFGLLGLPRLAFPCASPHVRRKVIKPLNQRVAVFIEHHLFGNLLAQAVRDVLFLSTVP